MKRPDPSLRAFRLNPGRQRPGPTAERLQPVRSTAIDRVSCPHTRSPVRSDPLVATIRGAADLKAQGVLCGHCQSTQRHANVRESHARRQLRRGYPVLAVVRIGVPANTSLPPDTS